MKDVFKRIDSWQSRFNILRDFQYLRKVALIFALSMIPVWFLLGFDSGVGIIEDGVKFLPSLLSGKIDFKEWISLSYVSYGRSFHFSSFTLYGLLFFALSKQFENLGLTRSKNSLYSAFLVLFNIGVFEFWYMMSFAHFQMNRNLIEWFTSDFWAPPVYMNFLFLVLGGFTLLAFWVDSFILNDSKIVGRLYSFKANIKILAVLLALTSSILLWIFYPFQVQTVTIGEWESSQIFPQTHYAYKDSKLYVSNDLLHLVNLIAKTMFVVMLFYVFLQFKREDFTNVQ